MRKIDLEELQLIGCERGKAKEKKIPSEGNTPDGISEGTSQGHPPCRLVSPDGVVVAIKILFADFFNSFEHDVDEPDLG